MTRVIIPGVTHMAIVNCGDGSGTATFFSSAGLAEAYMDEDQERYCDDIIDVSHGIEVDPKRWEWECFEERVANHIRDVNGDEVPERVLAIAEHFECAESAVRAWATGHARPHPLLREQVEDLIRRSER